MSRYVDALHRSPFLWESIRWHNPALRVRVRTRSRVQQIRTAIKVELNIMQTRERARASGTAGLKSSATHRQSRK